MKVIFRQRSSVLSDGDLVKVMAAFAAWRRCRACGRLALYVDDDVRSDSDLTCGACEKRCASLARECRSRVLPYSPSADDNRRVCA
jgi:hypothetical protein